jgi:DNA segregation ATPase FtsK/SpoIIIE-like protein
MIYLSGGNKMLRVHGPFCSDSEVEQIVNHIKTQKVETDNKYSSEKILSEFESVKVRSQKSLAKILLLAFQLLLMKVLIFMTRPWQL